MDLEQTNVTPEEKSAVATSLFSLERQDIIFRRVKDLFQKSGMSVKQLSRVTEIPERTLTRYFAGKTKDPHFYTLCTMIIAMGGDVNMILGVSPLKPIDTADKNPYGQLIDSYRNEAKTLRSALEKITDDLTKLTVRISHANKTALILAIALIIIVAVFCTLEIIDLSNPDWGRYQWAMESLLSFLERI